MFLIIIRNVLGYRTTVPNKIMNFLFRISDYVMDFTKFIFKNTINK